MNSHINFSAHPLTLSLIVIMLGVTQSRFEQFWITPFSTLDLHLQPNKINLVCVRTPTMSEWFPYCLKHLNVLLHLNDSYMGEETLLPVYIYEGFSVSDMSNYQSCSSVESVFAEPSGPYFLSLLQRSSQPPINRVLLVPGAHFRWNIPSYSHSCLTVCVKSNFGTSILTIEVRATFDEKRVVMLIIGSLLLLLANQLSFAVSFYYLTGSGLVVLGSLLIVLLIFIRLLPLRRGGVLLQTAVILLGGTFSLVCMIWDYIRSSLFNFLTNNIELTFLYICCVTCLSLLFFYWFHLPERLILNHPRTRTIMKCMLQVLGAILIISAIQLPLTEEELLTKFAQFISTNFVDVFNVDSASFHIIRRSSTVYVWFGLILLLMLLVNSMEFIFRLLSGKKHCSPIDDPACITLADFDQPSVTSPWTSSSPYHNHQSSRVLLKESFVDSTPRKQKFSTERSINRTVEISHLSLPHMNRSQWHSSFFNSHLTDSSKPNEDIITDDENE